MTPSNYYDDRDDRYPEVGDWHMPQPAVNRYAQQESGGRGGRRGDDDFSSLNPQLQ